jgi:hypothetical protein
VVALPLFDQADLHRACGRDPLPLTSDRRGEPTPLSPG